MYFSRRVKCALIIGSHHRLFHNWEVKVPALSQRTRQERGTRGSSGGKGGPAPNHAFRVGTGHTVSRNNLCDTVDSLENRHVPQRSRSRHKRITWHYACDFEVRLQAMMKMGASPPFPSSQLPRVPRPCRAFCDRAGILTSIPTTTPICSLFRAVHCDSISTTPSNPET
jgi:hypothetical protein